MLHRYQVLLTDWQADHIKTLSNKYDVSFSEAIRILLCLQIIEVDSISYPKLKAEVPKHSIASIVKKRNRGTFESEELHKVFSKIYFEARKISEKWTELEKKRLQTEK